MSENKTVTAPSMRPSKQIEGGGASFDGTVIDVYVGQNNYNGQVAVPATGIYILLRNDEAGPDAKPRYADFFSAAKGSILVPTNDGKEPAVAGPDGTIRGTGFLSARTDKPFQGLFKGSNALQLMEKIVAAGFKETDMNVDGNENDVRFLLGQRFHFALGELVKFEGASGENKPKMLPVKYLGKDNAAATGAQKDAIDFVNKADKKGIVIVGPNTPGAIAPLIRAKVGIMPDHVFRAGNIGIVSRSGTLTYEIASHLSSAHLDQSLCVGIGGDPIVGLDFITVLDMFEADEETRGVVLIGEVGGVAEEMAAKHISQSKYPKPVVAYIAGRSVPPGKRMGHAGAIIMGSEGTAKSKIEALTKASVISSSNSSGRMPVSTMSCSRLSTKLA